MVNVGYYEDMIEMGTRQPNAPIAAHSDAYLR